MTRREILGLCVLLVVISVYLADQLFYQPLKLSKIRLSNEQRQMIQELEKIDAQHGRDQNLSVLEPQIRQEYQMTITKIPFEPRISETIRYLEWGAIQSKVAITSCSMQDWQDKPKAPGGNDVQRGQNGALIPVKLNVIARGSRCNLLSFLLQIENAPRLMIIEDLSWSVDEPTVGSDPPGPGSAESGEAGKTGDALNDEETETLTIGLTFYCIAGKPNTS